MLIKLLSFGLEVLRTIDLDDQHRFDARKIDDVPMHWNLPTELVTSELTVSQPRPETPLGIAGLSTHRSRKAL